MFHGPPPVKIKRELTQLKELSPCHQDRSPMPYQEKCLYSYRYGVAAECIDYPFVIGKCFDCVQLHSVSSACDRKSTSGFKPLTPPSTPVSPCGSISAEGTHPLSEQTPPPHPLVANPTPGTHPVIVQQPIGASTGFSDQQLEVLSHSPPFIMPCAPVNQDANSFTNEHRCVFTFFI